MILITGLSGRSGKWFLKKMESDKAYFEKEGVRVLARKAASADMLSNSSLPLEVVIGDVADEHIVRQAMTNVSTVFHIVGIHTSRTIAKVAIAQGVDWLILVHTTGIYSKYKYAGETYRETERYIEQLAQGSNTRITIIRPTMIYGSVSDKNIIQFIKMVDKLKYFPVVSKAKYQLQPIHQKDLGEAYYKILKNSHITKGKNYILSGKEPIMLIDILKTIASIMNKNTVFFSVPFPIAYTAALMIWLFTLGMVCITSVSRVCESWGLFRRRDAKVGLTARCQASQQPKRPQISQTHGAASIFGVGRCCVPCPGGQPGLRATPSPPSKNAGSAATGVMQTIPRQNRLS